MHPRLPWTGAAALAVSLACGPIAPSDTDTGATTSAQTSTAAPTTSGATDPTTTSTTHAGSTGADPSSGSTGAPGSTGEATTEPGVCIADPATDTCTEACDFWSDCCRCDGQTIAIDSPTECTLPAGIVTAVCPWSINAVSLDGQHLDGGWQDGCGPDAQWVQYEQNGDLIVELCGDTCTAYLAGAYKALEIHMFCEAA